MRLAGRLYAFHGIRPTLTAVVSGPPKDILLCNGYIYNEGRSFFGKLFVLQVLRTFKNVLYRRTFRQFLNIKIMKKLLFPLFAAAAIGLAGCSFHGSVSTVDPALAAAVRATLESRDFTIFFDRATTLSAPPRINRRHHPFDRSGTFFLTTNNTINISGNFLRSTLPFIGDSHPSMFRWRNRLIFDAPITSYRMTQGRNGAFNIRFFARSFMDRYDFMITVFENGNVTMTVFPDRRSSITFDGRLRINRR